jgi:hypothetical protein
MSEEDWEQFCPLVVAELNEQAYEESVLMTKWGQCTFPYFERSWVPEHQEALDCGLLEGRTGMLYYFRFMHGGGRDVDLQHLREGHAENGTFPTVPAIHLKGTDVGKRKNDGKSFGNPTCCLKARILAKFSRQMVTRVSISLNTYCGTFVFVATCMNKKYFISGYNSKHNTEPIAYLPTDLVSRPRLVGERTRPQLSSVFILDKRTCP